jgi:hypothetical protein
MLALNGLRNLAIGKNLVQACFAEFINDHGGVFHRRVMQQFVEQGGFAATQKTSKQRDGNTFIHINSNKTSVAVF